LRKKGRGKECKRDGGRKRGGKERERWRWSGQGVREVARRGREGGGQENITRSSAQCIGCVLYV